MQCCGTSECSPANQTHGCCETMAATEAPRMLVEARVSLDAPAVGVVQHASMLETAMVTPLISSSVERQQYSPPDLYTLHNSLLI